MKKLGLLFLTLCASQTMQAYVYTYRNATNHPIYLEPYAWGIGGPEAQFKFFKGERKSNDAWGLKGPIMLQPGEQKEFNFFGLWCHGKIMAGPKRNQLTEVPYTKTNQEQHNRIISNLTKAAIGSSVATAGLSGALIFGGIQIARLFERTLCGNYSFIIGEIDNKGKKTYFSTATPF